MITSSEDIAALLREYAIAQHEYCNQLFKPEKEQWSDHRQAMYHNGVVVGKFREGDIATCNALNEGVTDHALYDAIKEYMKWDFHMLAASEHPNCMTQMKLECLRKQYENLNQDHIDEWVDRNCKWVDLIEEKPSLKQRRGLVYLYYAFENYSHQNGHPYNANIEALVTEYKGVFDKQSQFHKYGLIPIDEKRELLAINPPRIFDRDLNRTFYTKNVPLALLQTIQGMMLRHEVNEFAIRLQNDMGYDGRMSSEYLIEEGERGMVFHFVDLGQFSVSKLYAEKYEDCMWVVVDPPDITFEELKEDLDVYNDMIVTQVVHLQYEQDKYHTYITHLDHEYVFYTVDEYERRMRDVRQKGTAQRRMKSFKIDNSKIPFDTRCRVSNKAEGGNDMPKEQFLCYVLECYFTHKDLLKEYFQNV